MHKPALPVINPDGQAQVETCNLFSQVTEEPLDRVTRFAKRVMGTPIAGFSVVDRSRLILKSVDGISLRETEAASSFSIQTLSADALFVVHDARLDPKFHNNPLVVATPPLVFFAGVPIRLPTGTAIGALFVCDHSPRRLAPGSAESLIDLGHILEDELELRILTLQDALTGLSNRRHFHRQLEYYWKRSARQTQPLSLALIDIDHFKAFNDIYGHLEGDRCLKELAQALDSSCKRPDDQAFRIGGEEFAVIMGDSGEFGAKTVGERLRRNISDLAIPHRGAPAGIVTASVGVATRLPSPQSDSDDSLFQAADQALYGAKRLGRNRVVTESRSG